MTENSEALLKRISVQQINLVALDDLLAKTIQDRTNLLDYLYFHIMSEENVWLRPFVPGETDDPNKTDCQQVFVVELLPGTFIRFYVRVDQDPQEAFLEFSREIESQTNGRILFLDQ